MNKLENRYFEKLLTQQLDHIEGVINQEENALPVPTDEPGDDADLLSRHAINYLHMELSGRRHRSRDRIRAALRRLENGNFGECQLCGQDIEAARLMALPTAVQCALCVAGPALQEYRAAYIREVV